MKTSNKIAIGFFIFFMALPMVSYMVNYTIVNHGKTDWDKIGTQICGKSFKVLELIGEGSESIFVKQFQHSPGYKATSHRLQFGAPPELFEVAQDTIRIKLPNTHTAIHESSFVVSGLEYVIRNGKKYKLKYLVGEDGAAEQKSTWEEVIE